MQLRQSQRPVSGAGAMMNRMTPEDFREVIGSLEETPLVADAVSK